MSLALRQIALRLVALATLNAAASPARRQPSGDVTQQSTAGGERPPRRHLRRSDGPPAVIQTLSSAPARSRTIFTRISKGKADMSARYCQSRLVRFALVCSLAASAALCTSRGHAAVVLDYDLSAIPNAVVTTASATTVAPGLTATDLNRGAGIVATNLTRGFSSNDWATTTASRQNAIDTGEYYQFGFTVAPGGSVSLEQLDVSLRRSAIAAPMNYEWQYSLDGFATGGITISVAGSPYYSAGSFTYFGRSSGTGGVADNFNYMTVSVSAQGEGNPMPPLDLTGISDLQSISAGSTVDFRLYAWGDGSGASSNTVALGRNLGPRLTGVAVPEPSTFALAGTGIGLAAVAAYRRRGKQVA